MKRGELRELARQGAEVKLKQLRKQIAAIEREFPDLADGRGMAKPAPASRAKAPRATWTAAQRQEVSARMTRYWAKKRRADKAKQEATPDKPRRAARPKTDAVKPVAA